MKNPLARFLRERAGVSVLEYAMLVGLMAAVLGGVIALFGDNLETAITNIGGSVASVTVDAPGNVSPAP